MPSLRALSTSCTVFAALLALTPPSGAQLVNDPGKIPQGVPFNNSTTENVDFGDVDLDGDWDAVFADGGDQGNDQNRVWVNQGGNQGGTLGVFVDQTAVLFPVIADQSRDIELVDFDADDDLDLFISNSSQEQNQSNRWWTNQGLAQGGALGQYLDETTARWLGLGGAGSSVSPALVLPLAGALPGGFLDWSCDADFADFDDDGDLDLFQSTYGSSFGGMTPSRMFLNDGAGFFAEFNPSGFQLAGSTIAVGSPGLWCEGVFVPSTLDTSGAQCDIATNTLDIDPGDVDGDLDLDILHGDRDSLPRFFHNRLAENGGAILSFRDVSALVFPPDWATGFGHYEQELGDVDEDDDLDLYGLNWGFFTDRAFRNERGVFGDMTDVPGSGSDDNEADFFDYDNDGKLDVYVANFSGADKLYRNVDRGVGAVGYELVQTILVPGSTTTLDGDAADVDEDGDYDILTAADSHQPNYLLTNVLDIPDVTAPRLARLEPTGALSASTVPNAVRVQQYDNAAYYTAWYNETVVEIDVEGCPIGAFPMRSSGGQVFRAELPGNLLGAVDYRARATDEHANTGFSGVESYAAGDVAGGSHAIFGIDSGAGAPQIQALSVAFPDSTLYVGASGMTPGNLWLLGWNQLGLGSPIVIPGLAIANVAGINFYTFSGIVSASGCGVQAVYLPPGVPAVSTYFQMFEWPSDGPDLLDSSRGLRVDIQP